MKSVGYGGPTPAQPRYYTEAPQDGRAVFVMPHREGTLIGTTERPFTGDPDTVAASAEEIAYLSECYRHYFPQREPPQILASFAGLRVLPRGDNNPFHRSRDTLLHATHGGRLLSIYGGKLTAYRATAEKVLHRALTLLPPRSARASTRRLPLPPAAASAGER